MAAYNISSSLYCGLFAVTFFSQQTVAPPEFFHRGSQMGPLKILGWHAAEGESEWDRRSKHLVGYTFVTFKYLLYTTDVYFNSIHHSCILNAHY